MALSRLELPSRHRCRTCGGSGVGASPAFSSGFHLVLRLPPGHGLLPEVLTRLRELPAPA
jgi:hypothetical protein